ncbi:MAG TPA: phage holin family protein [Smithellaceae bacterium]|nr:phage holin family protein [Smithellaceae bacterium]HRS89231.1 phage holin family protein [Smithellaceae bacterium]HRV26311.1 phage holin family protein [Smithellaceae bacterium]
MFIITRWLIITVAILLASWLVPGITVESVWRAIFAAAILGLINTFIKPVLIILTLPLNILTLGIFTFFLNAFLLQLVAYMISGFEVKGFLAAFLGALIISIVSWLANQFVVRHKTKKAPDPGYIDMEKGDDGKWRQP